MGGESCSCWVRWIFFSLFLPHRQLCTLAETASLRQAIKVATNYARNDSRSQTGWKWPRLVWFNLPRSPYYFLQRNEVEEKSGFRFVETFCKKYSPTHCWQETAVFPLFCWWCKVLNSLWNVHGGLGIFLWS